MINLKLEGKKCDSCPFFEARTIKERGYMDNIPAIVLTEVSCLNRDICNRLERYLKKNEIE